jgi:hypothetical protein
MQYRKKLKTIKFVPLPAHPGFVAYGNASKQLFMYTIISSHPLVHGAAASNHLYKSRAICERSPVSHYSCFVAVNREQAMYPICPFHFVV